MADLPRFSPPAVPQGWDKVARPVAGTLWTAVEPLDLDHGYPCRVIAPNRPGVLQTKWVASLEVTT